MYRGRFAPSPTGALHAGSLVAALASWLDARAHHGQWLVRIEDVDTARTVPDATERILEQLQQCGLVPDAPPVRQSRRTDLYQNALDRLIQQDRAYPCHCTRRDIAQALLLRGQMRARHDELVYPGTCASGFLQRNDSPTHPPAWRFRTSASERNRPFTHTQLAQPAMDLGARSTCWTDRRLGPQLQDVASAVGDFVLRRADGCFTYQLAVVVDDGDQNITHVVRGEDLSDNTARQVLLQGALGLPTPHYLHTPLVLGSNGEKLSKQNGARPAETSTPAEALHALVQAAATLGLPGTSHSDIGTALEGWISAWHELVKAPCGRYSIGAG